MVIWNMLFDWAGCIATLNNPLTGTCSLRSL